jgi:hypothetical protein
VTLCGAVGGARCLLPLREKVAGHRASKDARLSTGFGGANPSSVAFRDTFSRKGRRGSNPHSLAALTMCECRSPRRRWRHRASKDARLSTDYGAG